VPDRLAVGYDDRQAFPDRHVLMSAFRRIGLAGTEMARELAVTSRSRLLKIGAQVKVRARPVGVHLSEAFPLQTVFWHAAARLRC